MNKILALFMVFMLVFKGDVFTEYSDALHFFSKKKPCCGDCQEGKPCRDSQKEKRS